MSDNQVGVAHDWPLANATISSNEVRLELPTGATEEFRYAIGEDPKKETVMRALAASQLMSAPVALTMTGVGIDGELVVNIYPDGAMLPPNRAHEWNTDETHIRKIAPTAASAPLVDAPAWPAPAPAATPVSPVAPHASASPADALHAATRRAPAPSSVAALMAATGQKPRAARQEPAAQEGPDFLAGNHSFIHTGEPTQGAPDTLWRKIAAGLGLKIGASPEQLQLDAARRAVAAQWGQTRRIAVVNGKGGVGKTTTAAMLSAVFAIYGAGNVLAWDNNPTRGSLGWRTQQSARHEATVQDVLERAGYLLDAQTARAAIADFTHHQGEDNYDVLRSNPQLLAISQQIQGREFDLLVSIIDRYFRLVIFDSGNDESAARWLRMIDWSHQLVIPTIPSPESAESARLLLAELSQRDEHSLQLAQNAIIALMSNEPGNAPESRRIAADFAAYGLRVHNIPFDAAMKSGQLRFGTLQKPTQNAWLKLAADAVKAF